VVVDYFDGSRWVRTDPEISPAWGFDFDVRDIAKGAGAPFETAAEVWLEHRAGRIDADKYGVDPNIPAPLRGADFVAGYVILQVAHRYGDELLLWDEWIHDPEPELVDRLATLLVAADSGDPDAERALYALYHADARLRPGRTITQHSPYGNAPVTVDLSTRAVAG